MGHSDTTLLQRVYAHSYADQQRAMELLADVLEKRPDEASAQTVDFS
jgi:hypothetical protein